MQAEKQLTYHPQACATFHSVNGLPTFSSTCGTPGGQ
jgi:hypothetical protein